MTGNPMITAAKMICKSIDALTREIYMLRKVYSGKGNAGVGQRVKRY